MQTISPHLFHIPVMGIAFTIDSPIKVASFGITSAISIIEDNLVETMRKFYYEKNNEPYIPIGRKEKDSRARRITDYLDLVNRLVHERFENLKASAFESGSDLIKYFEMLPEKSPLKQKYRKLFRMDSLEEKQKLEEELRNELRPGAVEVNIMTKVDKDNFAKDGTPMEEGSDALSALKGYAKSTLENSAVVFSAGMNPRLFNYLEQFRVFDAQGWGEFKKRIILKVSDYRSALIQGKYLAKKGIWVSEFRVESGLNCGGHAFATPGHLLGPILEEFKQKKEELKQNLLTLYNAAREARGRTTFLEPHPLRITVQGGIGTAEEDAFLHDFYGVDGTGWGTPFLLCPEATTVDEHTLQLLSRAKEKDVVLSKSSPLGVRFHYLKNNTAEEERISRIKEGRPGSPCTEKFLVNNTEFTKEPICTASRKYQKLKLQQLEAMDLSPEELREQKDEVLSKECLCIGLSNSASKKYAEPFVKKQEGVTICPGPNIASFSQIASLQEMTDHIYGRKAIRISPDRPNIFVKELQLYVDYLQEQLDQVRYPDKRTVKGWKAYAKNLLSGIAHYREVMTRHRFKLHERMETAFEQAELEIRGQLERMELVQTT